MPSVRGLFGVPILLVLLGPAPALGQVNTEKMRSKRAVEGFSGGADGTVSLRTGNSELLSLGGGFRIQHEILQPETAGAQRRSENLVFLVGNLQFAENAGLPIINTGFAHLRWTRMWIAEAGTELFTQYQFNEFIRLKNRGLVGAGVRVGLAQTEALDAYLGTGYMLEREILDVPEDGPDDPRTVAHRWTSYLSVHLRVLEDKLSLINTCYAQPRFDAFSDVRVIDDGELMIEVVPTFALGLALSLRYDSEPPAGVKSLDTALENKVRFSF